MACRMPSRTRSGLWKGGEGGRLPAQQTSLASLKTEFFLSLGSVSEAISRQLDWMVGETSPEYGAPKLLDLHLLKVFPTGHVSPKRFLHLRPEVQDGFVAIIKHELDDTQDDSLRLHDKRMRGTTDLGSPGHCVVHKSNTMRAGSSRHSLTRTRNVTASRPSTMR